MSSAMGTKLRDLRLRKNMTLEEVATRIGKTKATINKYETGIVTNIPRPVIEKLAEALEVSPGYLMGWTDESGKPLKIEVYKQSILDALEIAGKQIAPQLPDTSMGLDYKTSAGIHYKLSAPTDEEIELLKIFRSLTVKNRHKLMALAYQLEEETKK